MKLEAAQRLIAYKDKEDVKPSADAVKAFKTLEDNIKKLKHSKDEAILETVEFIEDMLKPLAKKIKLLKDL